MKPGLQWNGILKRSIDGSESWTDITAVRDERYFFLSFHPTEIDPNTVYLGASSGSWISTDKGKTWPSFLPGKKIVGVYSGNGDIVYALEDDPDDNKSYILYRSDDSGISWYEFARNEAFNTKMVSDFDIDPTDPNRLYAATIKGFYVFDEFPWKETSSSGGVAIEGGLKNISIKVVAVDPNNHNIVYAGLWAPGYGHRIAYVYRSTDFGITWKDIRFNLDDLHSKVWALAVDSVTSDVHMSTDHGNYVLTNLNGSSDVTPLSPPSRLRVLP